jgi:hypothetical protein
MSHFHNHFEFFNQPVWLTNKQQEKPYEVLKDFLDDYKLFELRHLLYKIVEACMTADNPHFSNPEQRANLLLLQVKVEMLFEAVSIINKRQEHNNLETA